MINQFKGKQRNLKYYLFDVRVLNLWGTILQYQLFSSGRYRATGSTHCPDFPCCATFQSNLLCRIPISSKAIYCSHSLTSLSDVLQSTIP